MTRFLMMLVLMGCGPKPSPVTTPGATTSPSVTTEAVAPPGMDLKSALKDIRLDRDVPSLAAAVASADEVLAAGASGKRVADQSDKVTWEDTYHLGSITKSFTAMLVARLVDDGQLTWDLTVETVFPDADAGWHGVTLEMLLRHEGGAPGNLGASHPDLWAQLFADGDSDVMGSRAAFAAELLAIPPEVTPGDTVYSNAGFMLVGAMMEAQLEQSWEDLLTTWVLTPLDMEACVFGPPLGEQPWGHDGAGTPMDPAATYSDNPPALGPAGTLACPMVVFARFGQAHLQAAAGDTSFLSADSAGRLQTSVDSDYSAGMALVTNQPWSQGPALVMNGSNTLWFATIWIAPGIDRVYVTATNTGVTAAAQATNDAVLYAITEEI